MKERLKAAALGFLTPPEHFDKIYNAKVKSEEKKEQRQYDYSKIMLQDQLARSRSADTEKMRHQNRVDFEKMYGKQETGYDREEDIPRAMGGLPLTSVKMVGGKYVPKYGKMDEDDARGISYYNKHVLPSDAPKKVTGVENLPTAYNPSTGERLVLESGKWVKPKTA